MNAYFVRHAESLGNTGQPKDAYERTAPVAQFAEENKFGLYDLGGNVWEGCSSEYRKSMNTAEVRKQIPALEEEKSSDGTAFRVLRGGSWLNSVSAYLLSSIRYSSHPADRGDLYGFCLVLEVGSGG